VPDTIAEMAETLKWGRPAGEAMQDLGRKNVPMPHDGYLAVPAFEAGPVASLRSHPVRRRPGRQPRSRPRSFLPRIALW
jgi:hypothetical protein